MIDELIYKLVLMAIMIAFPLYRLWIYWRSRDASGRAPVVTDVSGRRILGEISAFPAGDTGSEETKFQLEHYPGSPDSPTWQTLTVFRKSNGDFTWRIACDPANALHLDSKQSAVAAHSAPVKTASQYIFSGDKTFDKRFDVTTEKTPRHATACMQDTAIQAHLERLAELGFTLVRDDGQGLDAVFSRGFLRQIQGLPHHNYSEKVAESERAAFDRVAPKALVELSGLAEKTAAMPIRRLIFGVPESKAFLLSLLLPASFFCLTIWLMSYWTINGFQAVHFTGEGFSIYWALLAAVLLVAP